MTLLEHRVVSAITTAAMGVTAMVGGLILASKDIGLQLDVNETRYTVFVPGVYISSCRSFL